MTRSTRRPSGRSGRTEANDQRILESETPLYSPRWSATEDVLYYFSGERFQELWKLAVTPSGARQGDPVLVMGGLQSEEYFALARDGKRLAYVNAAFHSNLHRVDLGPTGSSTTSQLTEGTWTHQTPSVSPDGTQIAFARGAGQVRNIFTMPIGGGTPKQLTFFNSVNVTPAWSPDGRRIAFASMEGGNPRVSVVSATGGAARQFTHTQLSGSSMELVWSPSPKITYQRPGNRNFSALDPSTEKETPLLTDSMTGWMFAPRYSPSSDRVLAYWNRTPSAGLWLISFKKSPDGEETQLAKTPSSGIGSLASQLLSAEGFRGKEIRVRGFLKTFGDATSRALCYLRIDRANEQVSRGIDQRLNHPTQSAQWTPCEITAKVADDADVISAGVLFYGPAKAWADEFEVDVKDTSGTWQRVPIANAGFEETDQDGFPKGWSHAVGRLAVAADPYKGKRSLAIESVAVLNRDLRPLGWSPDGTRVYAIDRQARGAIVTMPSIGGNLTTVFTPSWDRDVGGVGVAMSPDARHFVFSVAEGKSDIWIVDNFDPSTR